MQEGVGKSAAVAVFNCGASILRRCGRWRGQMRRCARRRAETHSSGTCGRVDAATCPLEEQYSTPFAHLSVALVARGAADAVAAAAAAARTTPVRTAVDPCRRLASARARRRLAFARGLDVVKHAFHARN